MSENINVNVSAEPVQKNVTAAPTAQSRYTIDYCLEQMELITLQTEYLMQAMEELRTLETGDAGASKAMAIGNMVEQREKTNQRLIAFYEKVYDDLKPEKQQKKEIPSYADLGGKSSSEAQGDLLKDLLAQISNPMLDKETRDILKNGITKAMSNMYR